MYTTYFGILFLVLLLSYLPSRYWYWFYETPLAWKFSHVICQFSFQSNRTFILHACTFSSEMLEWIMIIVVSKWFNSLATVNHSKSYLVDGKIVILKEPWDSFWMNILCVWCKTWTVNHDKKVHRLFKKKNQRKKKIKSHCFHWFCKKVHIAEFSSFHK